MCSDQPEKNNIKDSPNFHKIELCSIKSIPPNKCLDIFKDDIVVKDDNFIFQVQCYIYLYFVLLCDFFYICLFDNY